MSFIDDKELNEYRNIMKPPKATRFEDGFSWKTVAGAIFLGFLVNPATDYLSLVIGNDANIGGAMKWVLVILFAEIAKRSFTSLRSQELYTLHFMAGAASIAGDERREHSAGISGRSLVLSLNTFRGWGSQQNYRSGRFHQLKPLLNLAARSSLLPGSRSLPLPCLGWW